MDDWQGGRKRKKAAEDLILRTIAAHADSLLRTARRHSMCLDDAQDAYQRAIELFMGHASRLDPARAPGWLHVVVKREAQAIQQSRRKLVTSLEVDLDGHQSESLASPEEQVLRFDVINRSAEALKRLKPHELRALWLRAEGHSYSDIGAITGWSYTKVNRCLSEGRRSFLEHYAGIESGEECKRWLPVLSAMVDGEATAEQIVELRPHLHNCAGCRATLRALQDSTTPLAALLPVPLVVADSGVGDQVTHFALRLYEGVTGGLHERAVNSFTKAQAVFEASAAGKVAAVAASAAAVAGGGYASVDRIATPAASAGPITAAARHAERAPRAAVAPPPAAAAAALPVRKAPVSASGSADSQPKRSEFASKPRQPRATSAPEFRRQRPAVRAAVAPPAFRAAAVARSAPPVPPPVSKPAPEFGAAAPEFAP
jgi:RNA polymerase sigma factor (sigma-70 family)